MDRSKNKIVVGCDIVNLVHFKKALVESGEKFLDRIFTPKELTNQDSKHLAGIFAAKEAVIKALKFNPGSWQKIEIVYRKNGKPVLRLIENQSARINSTDLSISHDGDYTIAIFVAIYK